MKRTPLHHALAIAALFTAGSVGAQDNAPAKSDRALIERVASNAEIIERFDGPEGMNGYLLRNGSAGAGAEARTPVVVWITDSPRRLVIGNVFDAWGRNLTNIAADHHGADNPLQQLLNATIKETTQRAQAAAKAEQQARERSGNAGADSGSNQTSATETRQDSTQASTSENTGEADSPETVREAVEQGNGVIRDPSLIAEAVGGVRALANHGSVIEVREPASIDAPMISIYIDPACVYCRDLHENLDLDALGGAGIRYIPVGLLDGDKRAIEMLAGGDAAAVDRAYDTGPADLDAASVEISDADRDGIRVNETIMEDTLMQATPAVVIEYPNADDKTTSAAAFVGMDAATLVELANNPGRARDAGVAPAIDS
mgnify:CR=1 FL=1